MQEDKKKAKGAAEAEEESEDEEAILEARKKEVAAIEKLMTLFKSDPEL